MFLYGRSCIGKGVHPKDKSSTIGLFKVVPKSLFQYCCFSLTFLVSYSRPNIQQMLLNIPYFTTTLIPECFPGPAPSPSWFG